MVPLQMFADEVTYTQAKYLFNNIQGRWKFIHEMS